MKLYRRSQLSKSLSLAVLALGFAVASRAAVVFSLTGLDNTLVRYDADTLLPLGSPPIGSAYGHYDLAFDETGRLFGYGFTAGQRALLEFDPASGSVLDVQPLAGLINGIAARGGVIYSLTGLDNTLVRYDADTLLPLGSAAIGSAHGHYDLAFDETGRLFGYGFAAGQRALLEFDPASGSVLDIEPLAGLIGGLAARGGVVYSLTGLDNTLVRYNADTLLPIGSAAAGTTNGSYDLAFDETGRLFGYGFVSGQRALLEFDPATGGILDSRPVAGQSNGLAASVVPEPSTVVLLLVGAGFTLASRRHRRRQPVAP